MNFEIINKVMQNYLTQENIFKTLDYSDLKSLRLVCSSWEEIFRPRFIRASCCSISSTESGGRNLVSFQRDFPDSSIFPFACFRFNGKFLAEDVERFLNDRPFISELTFEKTTLTNAEGILLKDYDISNWNELNLTALTIVSEPALTMYRIPLAFLQSIKKLSLKHAIVQFNERISPSTLRFNLITCIVDGVKLKPNGKTLCINDYVDVTKLKELQVTAFNKLNRYPSDSYDVRVPQIPLSLDLTNCNRLEHLYLHQISVIGWHNGLNIKRVEFDFGFNVSHLWNFYLFPPSVQEIIFNFFDNTGIVQFDTDLSSVQGINDAPHNDPRFFSRPITHINCGFSYTHRLPVGIKKIEVNDESGYHTRMTFIDDPDTRLDKLVHRLPHYLTQYLPLTLAKANTIVFDCISDVYPISMSCYECGGATDYNMFSAIEQQMVDGGTFVLKNVCKGPFRKFCDCHGVLFSQLFDIDSKYIICRENRSEGISANEFQQLLDNF